MAENTNRDELIIGQDMDRALREAAEIKRNILTTYKDRDKSNFEQFYATALRANKEIRDILDKKKKHRTEEENERVKTFKKNIMRSYKLVCDYITPEDVEDGKQTKIQNNLYQLFKVQYIDLLPQKYYYQSIKHTMSHCGQNQK